ncbi:hypothetical protein [Pseudoalteromonas sp. BSi20495]|uniref:hypothetical protein n=1 Tax=Pseudoalteromonas sp. BSi20495 TaxID=386429 RepID=UPI00023164B4|nr:hypothetical protein [Pseudoalteromonas sp. BSi20495]GAA81429.1 hypothetical protein P20495_3961 [Pseudoalteromonas sp. BSi20495]
MDFDKLAYPEKFTFAGKEHKGYRNMSKGEVIVPYTDEPNIGIGDVITQKSGTREIHLKVLDTSFLEKGSLGVGTLHPHILTLKVENTTSQPHVTKHGDSTFNIGSISGDNVQVGNSNTLSTNVTIHELTEKIAKSDDPEAKSKLKEFLQNSTVGSLIGSGASALIGML